MYKKGQFAAALFIVFGMIGLTIAALTYSGSLSTNLTGLSLTTASFIIPVAALGLMAATAKSYGII